MRLHPLVAALLAALAPACAREPEPSAEPKAAASQAPADAKKQAPGVSVAYDAPKRWEKVPPKSGFRKDAYRVPKADGDEEDGDLSVSVAGGSVDMNVDRWEKQFAAEEGEAPGGRSEKVAGDLKITLVERWGAYNGGAAMTPGKAGDAKAPAVKKGWGLLGAVVELPDAAQRGKGPKVLWFFKLVGPKKTVEAARKEFDELVASFRISG